MGFTDLVAPVAPPDRDDGELGQDDGPTDGRGHFLGALDAQTDVAIVVPDGYKSLEPGALTSASLLLHRHDLEDLVLEGRPQEEVDDLKLLDRQREQVDLLQRLDLQVFDKPAKLGDWHPFLVFWLATATPPASPAATPTTATSAARPEASTESSSASTTTGWCC